MEEYDKLLYIGLVVLAFQVLCRRGDDISLWSATVRTGARGQMVLDKQNLELCLLNS